MATEQQQEQQNGQGGAGGSAALGTNGEAAPRVGQAYGTASRAPLFPQQPEAKQEQLDAAPSGGSETGTQPKPGRGPVTTANIPPGALKDRLDRARAQGAEPFYKLLGVKSEAEAKEKLAKLNAAGEEAEKRRLAEMGEVDRLKAELDAERQKSGALEARLAEYESQREHEAHEQVVVRVAGEQINPKALKVFRIDLAQHVKKLEQTNPELAEKFGERGIKRFTEKWLKENPEFAKSDVAPAPAAPPAASLARGAVPPAARPALPAPVRRPVTTGAPPRKNPAQPASTTGASPATMHGKTARPGQANSMSAAEVKEFARRNGVAYTPL